MVFSITRAVLAALMIWGAAGCSSPGNPEDGNSTQVPVNDGSLRIAALDYRVGDLTDPAELAKYTRADLLIVQPDQFWGNPGFEGKLDLLRAAKPDLKIVAYFRSKVIKATWGDFPRETQTYLHDLYQAGRPYWCRTTEGDTLMDWPNAVIFDYMNPAARRAMLDVFADYQRTSSNKFDGVFWDYFNTKLWIAPSLTGMVGEPDMDGDGVSHWDDAEEQQSFMDAQYDWVREMQAAMGPDFIQVANGSRALTDSLFAAEFDGMFYEVFPNVGFSSGETFRRALDPNQYNNLFTARSWPRRTNGGPWLILSHSKLVGSYRDADGSWKTIDPGNLLRAVALLTDATSTHYDLTGEPRAGVPALEIDLGRPLGETEITGDHYLRRFERGKVELVMGLGYYPVPFSYVIPENGVILEQFGEVTSAP